MRDAAVGLLPDLRRRRVVMRAPVERVVVLVGIEDAVGIGGEPPPRFANRAVGALERIGEDQLRPVGVQDAPALRRDVRGTQSVTP